MRKSFFKKTLCVVLVLCSLMGVAACRNKGGKTDKVDISSEIEAIYSGNVDKITLEWMIPTQQSIQAAKTPAVIAAAQKFNINLVLKEDPVGTHTTKVTLGLSSKTLPDIISWVPTSNAKTYGPYGAYVNLKLYENEMPNFTAIRNSAIAGDPSNYNILYDVSGNYYSTPHYLTEPINLFDFGIDLAAFRDVKQRHNLTWIDDECPTTWDEIEQVLVIYKQEYEATSTYKCYPLTFRNLQSMSKELQLFVESYTEGQASTLDFYAFNEEEDKFEFAPCMDGYYEAVMKYQDWYKKGLISPDKTVDENNLKNQLRYGDCIMIGDYIGGWSGINYIQKYIGYKMYPLQIPQAEGKDRTMGRQPHNFDMLVGTALNGDLTKDPERLARAIVFLDYLYSEEFIESVWFNDDVTTKSVPEDKVNASLWDRLQYFEYNSDTVYNTSEDFDYQTLKDTYFPWSICNGFVDLQDERPRPDQPGTKAYTNYRDNVLRAPYKEGYDRETSEYKYGAAPTVLLTEKEQERVLELETAVLERFRLYIADFAEGTNSEKGITWESFINELLSKGGTEMINIYNTAYKRGK